MKKYLKDKCDEVMANLEAMHIANQSGSQAMEFDGQWLRVDERLSFCEQAEVVLKEIYERDQRERDYQCQFAPDGRDWDEV